MVQAAVAAPRWRLILLCSNSINTSHHEKRTRASARAADGFFLISAPVWRVHVEVILTDGKTVSQEGQRLPAERLMSSEIAATLRPPLRGKADFYRCPTSEGQSAGPVCARRSDLHFNKRTGDQWSFYNG